MSVLSAHKPVFCFSRAFKIVKQYKGPPLLMHSAQGTSLFITHWASNLHWSWIAKYNHTNFQGKNCDFPSDKLPQSILSKPPSLNCRAKASWREARKEWQAMWAVVVRPLGPQGQKEVPLSPLQLRTPWVFLGTQLCEESKAISIRPLHEQMRERTFLSSGC